MDSLSIFFLIDSVLESAVNPPTDLVTRVSYNSNILNLGRNFGLDQHGISPGASFYHKSGLFADYSGFWSNNFDPGYSLSVFSGGYMGSMGSHWGYTTTYEKWIYHNSINESSSGSLTNSLGSSLIYHSKFIYTSLDYSFLFGSGKNAHRLIGGVSGDIDFGKWWIFKNISILPSFTTYFGNQEIIIRFEGSILEELRTNEYLRQNLNKDELWSLLTPQEQQQIQEIREQDDRYARLRILNIYLSNDDVVNFIYDILDENKSQYGIMNYSFSLPLTLSFGRTNLMLSYTYSIPVQLPEEQIKLDPLGYFGASVSYRISFKD